MACELIPWSIVLLTFLRARHLLNHDRVLRAMAETVLGYVGCQTVVNALLLLEGIGPDVVGTGLVLRPVDESATSERKQFQASACLHDFSSASECSLQYIRQTGVLSVS